MRKPKKPKLKKYPKQPKRGASLATISRYKERCKDVDRANSERVTGYNKKIHEIKKAREMQKGIHGIKHKPKVHKFATL